MTPKPPAAALRRRQSKGDELSFEPTVAGRVPIIPRHVWEPVTDPAKFVEPRAVTGSGPYTLTSYDRSTGSYLHVATSRTFLGAPYVKRLEFVPAPNALVAGTGGVSSRSATSAWTSCNRRVAERSAAAS